MTIKSALTDLNNAVLDLQNADYNTYERPLKRLAAVLESEDLKEFTDKLRSTADFDKFVEAANQGGSMMGSASLNWPSDQQEELGLTIALIERGAGDPDWFMNFGHHYYYSGSKLIAGIRKMTSQVIIPFARDYAAYVNQHASKTALNRAQPSDFNRVFIVHGRDEAPRETVARFITNIGLEPVILHEQANRGMTITEKLIANGNVGFAVVLLTPDDVGREKSETVDNPRARQNVILELGYFVGALGRERVCALVRGSLEIPSDYMGVAYTKFDEGGGWRQELARELQAAGYEIDWNRVMR
ncbi:Predicted nucleotide-binding protein containing TIR-like domain-containing protein [Sphingomonas gellani]|uniref:Predicted nucleotide-binding protein containing TIR-like domain-containing protein n=1 Tax=Sphingomonas gellani TaxID=1166340 RepID=A0A1H7Y250_9SPHN|nr:nucleotide-binding protein [Sphingomonas gellani]SEM39934.1 Predicted nucleotide-binding protein containing TIR-like domain-containing protein [Sphingomonas gellani]